MPEKAKALLTALKLYCSTQPRTPAESAGGRFSEGAYTAPLANFFSAVTQETRP